MLRKNDLLRSGDVFVRILDVSEDRALIVRSDSKALPHWMPGDALEDYDVCLEQELGVPSYDDLTLEQRQTAHVRFTMIAPAVSVISDTGMRKRIIADIAEKNEVSPQTVKNYLRQYLLVQDISALAPKRRDESTELTPDEKKMRWALNKWFYSWEKQSLQTTYEKMLKAKYCDAEGKLLPERPSIHQFRYFYRKTKSVRKYVISRDGIKAYQRDHRPLLGDGVQEYCPMVGYGMLDATVCDIYLVNDAGQLVGRPILVACVDAYSGLCCGYSLLWEGGVYSLRELLLNTITDKVEWCRRFGIRISEEQWPCHELPAVLMTDMGTEFTSGTFEQITELGVTLINLDAYRPDLKGPVEKLFDVVQSTYKEHLKGKGVIEPDFQERGAHDYRKDACLTMRDFEKVILHSLNYYNRSQILENFPFTDEMLTDGVRPYSADIWNWSVRNGNSNLISVVERELLLTLLPRTIGKFTRYGLKVNKMRYHSEGFTDRYLSGGEVTVAFNPDDVAKVWLLENGQYTEFVLIESRYQDKTLEQVKDLQKEKQRIVRSEAQEALQAKIDLARHIEAIAGVQRSGEQATLKDIRRNRKKERRDNHNDFRKVLEG